jgi:hypothetical protein
MALVRRESVMPLHRQVQFGDSMADDYPQWETGEEKAVFTSQLVAVSTQADQAGDELVEVWIEPIDEELEGFQILDTEIQLVEGMGQFGNGLAGQLYEVELRPGWYRMRVLVAPTELEPSVVRFILDGPNEWAKTS